MGQPGRSGAPAPALLGARAAVGAAERDGIGPDGWREVLSAAAAALVSGGSKAFTPKDLELFEASEEQQRIIFRGA